MTRLFQPRFLLSSQTFKFFSFPNQFFPFHALSFFFKPDQFSLLALNFLPLSFQFITNCTQTYLFLTPSFTLPTFSIFFFLTSSFSLTTFVTDTLFPLTFFSDLRKGQHSRSRRPVNSFGGTHGQPLMNWTSLIGGCPVVRILISMTSTVTSTTVTTSTS